MKISSKSHLIFSLLCSLTLVSGFSDLSIKQHNDPDSIIYRQLSKKLYKVTKKEIEIAKELTNFPQFKKLISLRFNKTLKPGEDLKDVKNELKKIDSQTGQDITEYCD